MMISLMVCGSNLRLQVWLGIDDVSEAICLIKYEDMKNADDHLGDLQGWNARGRPISCLSKIFSDMSAVPRFH